MAGKKTNSNFTHNQLFSSFLKIFAFTPSISRTHSRMHAFASQTPATDYFETTVFGTMAKNQWDLIRKSSGHLIRISPFVTNHIRCYNESWKFTQSPACFNITSLPSLHHIFAANLNPRLNPSNHYSTSSRHVTSSHSPIYVLTYLHTYMYFLLFVSDRLLRILTPGPFSTYSITHYVANRNTSHK